MSITINDALELKCFKNFKVIAGRRGLSNRIKKVGILDYEIKELIAKNFVEDEFVLSTLINIKDNIKELYEIVETLIVVGVSGLAIKPIYFDKIPDDVIELANRNDFPIMMFSETYFEDIITDVMVAIRAKEERETLGLKIDNILYSDLNKMMIKKIAYEINGNFREKNIIVFCKNRDGKKYGKVEPSPRTEYDKTLKKFNKIIPYHEGYIIINTFKDIEHSEVNEIILTRLEALGFNSKQYIIGISSLHEKLDELNDSIKESMYAFKHSKTYDEGISFFNDIGINKILLPLMDNPWLQRYYDEMITPLLTYDTRNDTELLKTAIAYVKNNGDVKETANELYQHSNTIRYRIDRISKVLRKKNDIKHFYEELAVAIRIHNILNT